MKKILKGFTLIELILVLGIVGMFAAGIVVTINPSDQYRKGLDGRRKADLANIQKAIEFYYQDHGQYPSSTSNFEILDSVSGSVTYSWGTPWTPYMSLLPKDPSTNKAYVYFSTGQTYYLFASLDRGAKDVDSCNNGDKCVAAPVAATCGDVCNFGLSSPNTSP